MEICKVEDCIREVAKAGYTFCLQHWKAERGGLVAKCQRCQRWHETGKPFCRECLTTVSGTGGTSGESDETELSGGYLSSTRIGRHFGVSNIKINLILAELGWIERYVKGWVPTDRGNAVGAHVKEMRNGTPYTVWPESILSSQVLCDSVAEQSPGQQKPVGAGANSADKSTDFRAKFPANFRAQDGHLVRSRAEALIDNWLYMQGIVHAYERRLPIETECYCDFYLPGGRGVYIEYWGLEADPKYRERKAIKQAIYTKHGLRLIELSDPEIERLDDVLPRLLLRFGIESA